MTSTTSPTFMPALRINRSLTASAEKSVLHWMSVRAPAWLTSDQLTTLGFTAQIAAGACYALARFHRYWLLAGVLCLIFNWFGDSMDGTLARVRQQQRPRYGFYVDHIVDIFGSAALLAGLALSGFIHPDLALALLIGFLLLAGESYLATYTLGRFEMSQGLFGPTELRLLLIAGNLALIRSPWSTILGHRFLLFDIGGVIASVCMGVMVLTLAARHTAELYRQEPLP